MAQHDVHRTADGEVLVVDCQSDLLWRIKTRFVVPLIPERLFRAESPRLNPVFLIGDRNFVLAPQGAMSLMARELGPAVASLRHEADTIIRALDMLLHGI